MRMSLRWTAPLVALTARAIEPGEVIRLDITAEPPSAIRLVRVFERTIPVVHLGASHWRALIGIDLDTAPGDYAITIETESGPTTTSSTEQLAVQPREFPTRQLRVAPRFVNPPASMQRRIDAERRRLGDLFRAVRPEPGWSGSFVRPIEVSVVSGFGVRSVYNGEPRAPHNGADFASATGTPVLAPGGGRVVLAESLYFTGQTVVIDHGLGLVSLLAHLSRIDVRVGADVVAGVPVGLVGATGRVTGPHLHWTVRLQGARVDPLSVIAALQDAGPRE